jgi:predicted TIM-barrel fold metal-dependent hydrolase
MTVIDSDQHLVEYRGLWSEHMDPADRELAVDLVDDERGWTRLMWQDRTLGLAEVQDPGQTAAVGGRTELWRTGARNTVPYDEALPRDHWDPAARAERLTGLGLDGAVVFPNFGLFWERRLSDSLPALRANMTAWNRWCATVVSDGGGRLHPVAHLTLRDLDWFEVEVRRLAAADVHLAMLAPALVDGLPLSHPDLDRAWSLLVDHGITPVFHVADQPRPFDDGWYTERDDMFVPTIDAVFIWTAAALSCTDLIVNGVFERHPDLRLGIVELSAVWVPMFLLMLDGGVDFTSKLNGRAPAALSRRPSEYLFDHVRVSSFAYELPERIVRQLGGRDVLMACSDYPHTEGTLDPLGDYERSGPGLWPADRPDFFGGNAQFLLRQDA